MQVYGTSVTGWQDPASTRGNPTTSRRWLDTTNTWIETHAEYDQFGNLFKTIDARTDRPEAERITTTEYSATYQYAYPTRTYSAVPDASGQFASSVALQTSASYDLYTGLVTSSTDVNGLTTSFSYDDLLNRLKQVSRPDGGQTTYTYVDAHQCGPYVETRTLLDSSGRWTDSYQFFDGMGRPYLVESNDPQDVNNPWLRADTQYDALGRASKVSNPYRSSGCGAAANPSGRWTTTLYDALGRVKSVTTPDGAAVTISYSGNQVTVTDQQNKLRSSVSDALGRVISVTEAPGVVSYGFVTNYTYDALGNPRKVDQGSQQRFFMYDSLGRLTRVKNPEQTGNISADSDFPALTDSTSGTANSNWSMGYSHDANGNLTKRKDARNIVAAYGYDGLNRNTTVTYANDPNNTPPVTRRYDGALSGKGRFWYSSVAGPTGSRTYVDEYDAAGRPKQQRQRFATLSDVGGGEYLDGQWWSPSYRMTRTYDLVGSITSQAYPSGHTVYYSYDDAGRLGDHGSEPAFKGNLGDGWTRTYAGGLSYDEFGHVQQERFGTLIPLYHKRHYNVRGQLFDVRLSTNSEQADPWNWNRGAILNYFSTAEKSAPTNEAHGLSGTDNNGDLLRGGVYVPTDQNATYNGTTAGSYFLAQDDYEYDPLNRLFAVTEYQQGQTPAFREQYHYDRYGNRRQDASTWGVLVTSFGLDDTKNQLTWGSDMIYDATGNLTADVHSAHAYLRTYDAENRMTKEVNSSPGPDSVYAYDADGHRTRRNLYGLETWQVYGMDGELLAEYQAQAAPIIAAKEYGYRDGQLLVTAANGDDQRLTRFISQLYNALGRGPNSSELQAAVAALSQAASQGPSQLAQAGRDIARTLFDSVEYSSRNRTDSEFVNDLYWTYCRRGPDAGGYQAWLNTVPVYGRAATRDGFAQNGEFTGIASRVFGLSSSEDERTQMYINTVYGALQRGPTSAEMTAGVNRLNAATEQGRDQVVATARAIGSEVFNSQEYANLNKSDHDFVYDLYWVFLNRAPDQAGWDAWANSVPTYGRPSIVSGFTSGGEFQSVASALYRETLWLVPDHLGTPRMVVARTGSLTAVKRHDYLPFGAELFANVGGRTQAQGYTSDNVRQKFADSERDGETGLDFMQARYYSSTQGRFTSPDPFMGSAYLIDPQSLNRYTYCLNDPLNLVDATGLAPVWVHDISAGTYFSVSEEDFNNKYKGVNGFEEVTNTGSEGFTLTLTRLEGNYANDPEYQALLGKEVYLGEDGRFHAAEPQEGDILTIGQLEQGAGSISQQAVCLPDFYQGELDFPIDPERDELGIALQLSVDRHGGVYFGLGGYGGNPGFNLTGGYLTKPNSPMRETTRPTSSEMADFMTGLGVGGSVTDMGGRTLGGTITTIEHDRRFRGAYQVGVGSPGAAVSGTYGWNITRFSFLERYLDH